MSKDLIRLMHALFLPGAEACLNAPWQPNTDVYRTATGWLVKFELAGVRAEDIDLQVLGNRMTLAGHRRDSVLESAQKARNASEGKQAGGGPVPVHYRMEIAYSQFERTVELPCDVKRAHIATEFRDGMLLVRIDPEQ